MEAGRPASIAFPKRLPDELDGVRFVVGGRLRGRRLRLLFADRSVRARLGIGIVVLHRAASCGGVNPGLLHGYFSFLGYSVSPLAICTAGSEPDSYTNNSTCDLHYLPIQCRLEF